MDPADQRTAEIQPEDLREFQPVRRYLTGTTSTVEAGGSVQHAARWSRWDAVRWGAPYVGIGVLIGMLIDIVVRLAV